MSISVLVCNTTSCTGGRGAEDGGDRGAFRMGADCPKPEILLLHGGHAAPSPPPPSLPGHLSCRECTCCIECCNAKDTISDASSYEHTTACCSSKTHLRE